MSETMTLTYNVDGDDFVSCGKASEDVKRTLKSIGVPSDVIRKVAIAMYEGEVNMVIHGGGGVATVSITDNTVVVELKDTGKGIADIEQAMQEGWSTASDEIRELGFGAGMGLPNMKKYSDKLEIESTVGVGTTIYLTFNL